MIYTIDSHYVLQPADQQDTDPRGLVLIFEPPRRSANYVIGVDPTVGIPRWDRAIRTIDDRHTDNAAIEVIRVGDPDVQVCEFVAPIDPYALAPYVNALGRFYAGNSEEEEALVVVEVYPGPGFATQRDLMDKFGYTNLYQWKSSESRNIPKITDGLGFYADKNSVRDLWIRGIRQVSNKKLDIKSEYFLEELASCQFDVMRQRGEACFVAGTKVLLRSGLRESIENISHNTQVITKAGTAVCVDNSVSKSYSGDLLNIDVSGSPEIISCTPDHRVWARKRSVKYLQRYAVRKEFPPNWIDAQDLKVGDWVGVPKRTGLPKTELSFEQLYTIGFWLAEGNYARGRDKSFIALELSNTDRSMLERCAKTLSFWFPEHIIAGYNGKQHWTKAVACKLNIGNPRLRKNWKPSYRLRFSSYTAVDFFSENCGTGGCAKKVLSEGLFSHSGLLPLVVGFIDGDGTQRINQQNDVSLYTTSEKLAWQLRQILLDEGVWCTIHVASPREGRHPQWVVNIKSSYLHKLLGGKIVLPTRRLRRLVIEDDTCFYTPVKHISRTKFDGVVYDLSLVNEHSYTANGIAVHNCGGGHDDRVSAMWMAVFAAHDWGGFSAPDAHEVVEGRKPVNWQASDCTAEEMNDEWERIWEEMGGDE
jgi:hypothetical protein